MASSKPTATQKKKDKLAVRRAETPMPDLPYEIIEEIYVSADEDSIRTLALAGSEGRTIAHKIINKRHAKIFGPSDKLYQHKINDLALYNLIGSFLVNSDKLTGPLGCILEINFEDSKVSFSAMPKEFRARDGVRNDAIVSTGMGHAVTSCPLDREAVLADISKYQTIHGKRITSIKLMLYKLIENVKLPISEF